MPASSPAQQLRIDDGSVRVALLGSGSSGNAAAVTYGTTTVLVDVGFSARETLRRLAMAAVDAGTIRAIVVTHEHVDHMRGVRVLSSRLGVPVFASRGTLEAAALQSQLDDPRRLGDGSEVSVGPMRIRAFAVSHDAAEPIGVRVETPAGAVGLASDTGHITDAIAEELADCRILGIECNHDVEMLVAGPYPWHLKRRILSERGHLSNEAAGAALEYLMHDSLRAVVGLHLSRTNNTPEVALSTLRSTADRLGTSLSVCCATHDGVRVVHAQAG